jgi:hypothetical protein
LSECLQRGLLLSSDCGPTLRFSEGVWSLSTQGSSLMLSFEVQRVWAGSSGE